MKLDALFYFCGPSWRADTTLIEMQLLWSEQDLSVLQTSWEPALQRLRGLMRASAVHSRPLDRHAYTADSLQTLDLRQEFAQLLANLALQMQIERGHRVSESRLIHEPQNQRSMVLFEHEESSIGERAGLAALRLLQEAFSGLDLDWGEQTPPPVFAELYPAFQAAAQVLVQPPDTKAIVDAAKAAGVPVIKLERDPYEPVSGDFRIRMNSMLMLGHCAHRQIIDGTFALQRSGRSAPLLNDRAAVIEVAQQLGFPIAPRSKTLAVITSAEQAQEAAVEIGYPLVLKTANKRVGVGARVGLANADELQAASAAMLPVSTQLIPESKLEGKTWTLLIANHALLAVFRAGQPEPYTGRMDDSIVRLAEQASRHLNVGLLALTLVCKDIGQALEQGRDALVDMDVAPQLDRYLLPGSGLMQRAAEQFVAWLVPEGAASRLPLIGVTGTNGKTTTSRMAAHILKQTGKTTALLCTDGRYVNETLEEAGDQSVLMGQCRVFENPAIEQAVFECHHRGIAEYGYLFDQLDVAVCTNVSDDHIGTLGIRSVEEMAVLKRSLPERASKTVVLNIDNAHCEAMVPHFDAAKLWLVSTRHDLAEMRAKFGDCQGFCLLESRQDEAWVVVHEQDVTTPLMPVNQMPASFDGLALCNIENALQAVAATRAQGIDFETIRLAMASFQMSAKTTPWRFNFYQGLPFKVLVDFAHNPDGMARIAEFADAMTVSGRKTLAFSGFRSLESMAQMCRTVAGHYDRYVIKHYNIPEGKIIPDVAPKHEIETLMTTTLEQEGVPVEQILVKPDEVDAIRYCLDTAEPGDLVVLLLGYAGMSIIEALMEEYIANATDGSAPTMLH